MADKSHIEWTDATWNPVTGCSIVSPGCTHCYAMKLAGTRLRNHPSRAGLTTESKNGPVWNGTVRFNEGWLRQPLGWKKPRMIFVCAHGDLFHEDVPDDWIDQVFGVMYLAPRHTFQVLTKRAGRLARYFENPTLRRRRWEHVIQRENLCDHFVSPPPVLPNVWMGVSVERQQEANERIPHLLKVPAAKHFLSIEPMLGPINLTEITSTVAAGHDWIFDALTLDVDVEDDEDFRGHLIDWVIVGGESGNGARPMHPQWARDMRDQCAAASVPFFFKQWGLFAPLTSAAPVTTNGGNVAWPNGRVGAGHAECDGGPGEQLYRATKAIAGRHLDGVLHDAMPARPVRR